MPKPERLALAKPEELTDEQKDMTQLEMRLLEAEFGAHSQDRFPDRFLAKRAELDAAEAHVKEECKKWIEEIKARRRALEIRYGQRFRDAVQEDLNGVNSGKAKPRKLIRYANGQAGFRKAPDRVVVHDENAATQWAWANVKEACDIKLARTKPLLEYIKGNRKVDKETGEEIVAQIPGVEFVEGGDKPSPKLEALDALQAPKPESRQHTPVTAEPKEQPVLGDIAEPAERPAGMPF